jgi:hypothetical protein
VDNVTSCVHFAVDCFRKGTEKHQMKGIRKAPHSLAAERVRRDLEEYAAKNESIMFHLKHHRSFLMHENVTVQELCMKLFTFVGAADAEFSIDGKRLEPTDTTRVGATLSGQRFIRIVLLRTRARTDAGPSNEDMPA